MNARKPTTVSPVRFASSPLSLDQSAVERFLAHCQRRRYPNRTDVFRPGDPAGTLYYVVNGSVSIIAEEEDGRELVLGYYGAGEFVGEMGLFIESDSREVILRTRSACELAEISYDRLQQLMLGPLSADAPRLACRECRSRQKTHPFICDARTLINSLSAGVSPRCDAASDTAVANADAASHASGTALSM